MFKYNKDIGLVVIGDVFMDIIVPRYNLVDNAVNKRSISVNHGGLANVAYWSSKLGIKTAFLGRRGDDYLGDMCEANLIANNVLTYLSKGNEKTGICISLINKDGERTMIVNRGENDNLKFTKKFKDVIKKSKMVYISGYSFSNRNLIKNFIEILKFAKKNNANITLSGGSYNIIEGNRSLFKKIISNYVDFLILNKDEAISLTNKKKLNDVTKELAKLNSQFIVTLGKEGSIYFYDNKVIKYKLTKKVKAIDTTGAGDAFAAAFLACLMKKNFGKAIKKGHEVAGYVVQKKGAR